MEIHVRRYFMVKEKLFNATFKTKRMFDREKKKINVAPT